MQSQYRNEKERPGWLHQAPTRPPLLHYVPERPAKALALCSPHAAPVEALNDINGDLVTIN